MAVACPARWVTRARAFWAASVQKRHHGELDWQTPGERFDGTPFTDRGFGSVPALANVADLLDAILVA